MNEFLEQTSIVKTLINSVLNSLNFISNEDAKERLINALEPFYSAVTPSAIYIEEIKSLAIESNFHISQNEALEILENVMYDIDLNCIDDSIKFHFNEFICNHPKALSEPA